MTPQSTAPIRLRTQYVYGRELIYPVDSVQAMHIQRLTGRKTLTYGDLDALYALGVTVEWVTS